MTIQQQRELVAKAYDSASWAKRVKKMSDKQIIAVYMRLKLAGRI